MDISLNNGICRCCASEGTFKDLSSTYQWMGEKEIYSDMLKECFDIHLSFSEDSDEGGICEICISQLRNASNFKKQVLHTEKQFKNRLHDKLFKNSIVKVELPGPNDDALESDNDNNVSEDFSGTEFDVPIKEESPEDSKPKKRATRAIVARAKKTKTERGESSSKRRDGDATKRKRKKKKGEVSATPERVEHRVNLTAILQYSNASPFRDKTIRGFSCLYCAKSFQRIDDLRAHTALQSEKDKLNSMIDYKLSYNPIKLDITNLKCTVCDIAMRDLNDLKDHLINVHNRTIHKDIKDIILPFRLENGQNFTCDICSAIHVSFKNLYHHMSSHYRNYCCKKCGAGYITIAALRKHGKTHAQGIFPCAYCEKSYTSLTKKRNHEKGVHTGGWLRNKCPHCPEIFVSYYDRSEHLVRVHNEAPIVYPCNACNKTYKKKFELNRHIKHHHLQQRSFMCDKCNSKFFSKRGLVDHISRHSGGEVCTCDVCGKTFSRQRTLKEHMKLHEDDKRYQCQICKKTFMQKCSLKSHVRLHQDDLDIFKEFDDVKHLIDNRELTLKEIAAESRKKEQEEKLRNDFTERMEECVLRSGGVKTEKVRAKPALRIKKEDERARLIFLKSQSGVMAKHRRNVTEILLHSNATPILTNTDLGYSCCYCRQNYLNPADLKRHTLETHKDEEKTQLISEREPLRRFYVKMDITDLKCTVCDSEVESIEQLLDHFQEVHKINIHTDINNHCVPFKFEGDVLKCYICSSVFNKFKIILEHMNVHCRNYICEECDAGFITQNKLLAHKSCHKLGHFVCEFCPKSFDTYRKKKLHEKAVHIHFNLLHKCAFCNERFTNMKNKADHMTAAHGVKKVTVKCRACDKDFNSQNELRIHTKRDHLMERRHKCSDCDMKFFSKHELTEHKVKHSGERNFQCKICMKSYGRRKTLTEHMRIHANDRRFKCEFCGQAFVQKCSWLGHMRSKHRERDVL